MVKGKTNASASWLVNAAQQCVIEKDTFAAKAWLLTAKTLFPADFSIQYEEFLMEREAGNVHVCGKLFYDMLTMFSKEPVLWEELSRIFHSQDVNKTHPENKFLKEMFDSLPVNHQKELLLKYANHQEDLIHKCRISLLVLKRFKGAIKDQGEKLISTLKSFEDKEFDSPLNMYRKMIVCDILPLVIKSPNTQVLQSKSIKHQADCFIVSEDQMISYLNMTMQFFVAYAIKKASVLPCANDTSFKEEFELDESISSWSLLHENFVCFATKLGWSNVLKFKDKVDPSKNRPLKSRWKSLSKTRDVRNALGLFYAVFQLHIFAMLEYCSIILKCNQKASSPSSIETQCILVDNVGYLTSKEATEKTGVRTPKKKKKSDDTNSYSDYYSSSEDVPIIIHPDLMGHVNENIGEYLQVAIDTQNFLKIVFKTEYEQISLDWKMNNWKWTDSFEIDALLFQGKHAMIINALKNKVSMKHSLQLSSALFSSGYHKMACETVLHAVNQLHVSAFEDTHIDDKMYQNLEGRSLLLLSSSPNDVLIYAVQVISASLKALLNVDDEHQDFIIGHLIVLSQLMWPMNEDIFLHLLKLVQVKENGFKYPLFFTYITQIDILEEFAYLYSSETVSLELSLSEETTKHTITRGVNKEAQNDFKASVMRQVAKSNEPIKSLIFQFLRNEKEAILGVML
ncbi:integrator complex subunit 10 isoform X4 [Hydra vulgaris]|uniref:Integrator complex subunit 10 n=1 Tax=Hydra vulgaris TaxID=6087 RepID=A0ABM4B4R9_HYDVU